MVYQHQKNKKNLIKRNLVIKIGIRIFPKHTQKTIIVRCLPCSNYKKGKRKVFERKKNLVYNPKKQPNKDIFINPFTIKIKKAESSKEFFESF